MSENDNQLYVVVATDNGEEDRYGFSPTTKAVAEYNLRLAKRELPSLKWKIVTFNAEAAPTQLCLKEGNAA